MDEKPNDSAVKFSMNSDEALQVLCAALQSGSIKLPFGGVVNQEMLQEYLDSEAYREAVIWKGKEGRKAASQFISNQLSVYSQADVTYLMMLFIGLQRGLTPQELSEFFISAAQK